MTASDQFRPSAVRTRTLRDDLLHDLRQAAPMPPQPQRSDVHAEIVLAERTADRPHRGSPRTPTLELRVTPKRWWGLRMKTLGEEGGFLISVGPVQLSLTGFSR